MNSPRQEITNYYLKWARSRLDGVVESLDKVDSLLCRAEDMGIDTIDPKTLSWLAQSAVDLKWKAFYMSCDITDILDKIFQNNV